MNEQLLDNLKKIATAYKSIKSEIANVIVGQDEVIDQVLIAILSRASLPAARCARPCQDPAGPLSGGCS